MEIVNGKLIKCHARKDIIDGKCVIPEGVTTIGENAFSSCQALTDIEIPESVINIEANAFHRCQSLRKINLPENIKFIGDSAFHECVSLTHINIPEKVTSIGNHAFAYCDKLTSIKLPSKLEKIEDYTFFGCEQLTKIKIPKEVTSIGVHAFAYCAKLTGIELPPKLKRIENGTFLGCQELTEIEIPEGVIDIKYDTFNGCTKLTKVRFPNTIERLGYQSFGICPLQSIKLPDGIKKIDPAAFEIEGELELITPWQTVMLKGTVDGLKISLNYAYLYANSILKDKYKSIDEFLSNAYIKDTVNEELLSNEIYNFKKIFYKTRKEYDIPPDLIGQLIEEQAEKFDLNTWKKIHPIFNSKILRSTNLEMYASFAEIINVFGLFEKDDFKNNRIEEYKKFINRKPKIITKMDLEKLAKYFEEYYDEHLLINEKFEEATIEIFCLKSDVIIPDEFNVYLSETLTQEKISKIKKLTGTYGKNINKFIQENYEKEKYDGYRLKEEYNDDLINKAIYYLRLNTLGIDDHTTYENLHRIFNESPSKFNEDFYNFFIENIPFILSNEKLQSKIKNIQEDFESIKKHYSYSGGAQQINLKQAVDYINNKTFEYHDGNYELAQDVKKAGVGSQEAFEYYQSIFEKNDIRKLSSLVKRSNIYEIDGYIIKAELLRKDDSFNMLVGESNYTNCCQVFGGVGHNCMAHATNSDDGGVFVTQLLKDGEWILLTQSWDWQNNNVYCHDNIEATPYLYCNNDLKKAVAEAYRLDGEHIIKKSKEEVENYIKTRKKIIEKSLSDNKEKEIEELRNLEQREVIRVVTTGSGNDDLGLNNYFYEKINVAALGKASLNNSDSTMNLKYKISDFQPVNYNASQVYFNKDKTDYTDSRNTQYIIAGSIEELCLGKQEPLVPIYRDERRIVLEKKQEIRDYTTNKLRNIEKQVYPENMLSYQDISKYAMEDSIVYLGEDWYLVYRELNNNKIYISDLAKINPSLEDESGIQNQEIMHIIYDLVKRYDTIEADLKEDTSYLLFLINKKLGYLEQIGNDTAYSFDNHDKTKIITIEEQENILNNAKKIKESKNPEQIMHNITFKKGRRLKEESKTK